jgi:hypothetical protein
VAEGIQDRLQLGGGGGASILVMGAGHHEEDVIVHPLTSSLPVRLDVPTRMDLSLPPSRGWNWLDL